MLVPLLRSSHPACPWWGQVWPGPPGALCPVPSLPSRQQELDNLLHEKRYLRALGLAISLDRPHTVLTVIQGRCYLGPHGVGVSWGLCCPFPRA